VDWGETVEAALKREFREEVGLELENIEFALLQEAILDPQFYRKAHFILLNYWATSATETIVPNEEIVKWDWLLPEEALLYPLNSYTKTLLEHYLVSLKDNP